MESIEEEDVGEVGRVGICQGPVILKRGWKNNKRYLSLFNDVLVVSSNLNKKKFKVKDIIPLKYLWIGDEVDVFRTDDSYIAKSIHLYWPRGNAVATFRSMEQTIWWYFFLQRSIHEAKKKNKTDLSLQIFTEDIERCDSPLYVTATNIDTVNDVINKLLPMIGKYEIEDYQLWFCPGHEAAPRALQGHEYPHDIVMINIQKNFSPRDSRNFKSLPYLPGLLVKYLNSDAQGQFILMPRDSARSQQQKNAKERHGKKQKTSIKSWFHRDSVPHKDQVCTIPNVNKRANVFGKELISIFEDGNIPSVILDILSLINEKGPATEGVFIIPPDVTLFQTLKAKLDSGEEVDIKNQSVHVAAWILKEFIRKIKGSLMTSTLHNEWLAVLEKVNDKEKLSAVQSLLEKLPPQNAVLLGHLFRILNKIAINSSVNQMTSYNLSVGIAPYIFCFSSSSNKVLPNDIAKEITLVNFLIKNSPKIFGLEFVPVWYETSLFHPQGAKATGSQDTPTNMETIKKTEHELSSSPSERPCTPDHHALPKSLAVPLLCDCIIDSEKEEENVCTTQPVPPPNPPVPPPNPPVPPLNPPVPPPNPPAPKKTPFGPIFSKDRELSATMHNMLTIIAEKGQESDQIFRYYGDKKHWCLRDKIYGEQEINWNEEPVLTIASVLKDILKYIPGSLLSDDLYLNWLNVPDEGPLMGKISAIQSILLKIPQPNYVLLKHLIRVLSKIKASSTNRVDTPLLSLRVAPHVLWDTTCRRTFESDLKKKMSIIEIMIDNCLEVFGEDDSTIHKDNQKTSDDIKISLNNAAGDNKTTSEPDIPQRKLIH